MFTRSTSPRARFAAALLASASLVACGSDDDEPAITGNAGNPPPPPVSVPSDLYVFGDSLSDAGNLGGVLPFGVDLPSPFYMNRISNGPVIVDYIAQSIGQALAPSDYLSSEEKGRNYSIAGARARGDGGDLTLAREVDSFTRKNAGKADPADTYLIFIGGNDILDAVGTVDAAARLDLAAAEVGKAIQTLATIGARRFIVLNAPDIGRTPKIIAEEAGGTAGRIAQATALSTLFNQALQAQATALASTTLSITMVDAFTALNGVLDRAPALGFTNTTQACYVIGRLAFADTCNATLLDSYAFFDDIHPSARTHRLAGEEIAQRIAPALKVRAP